MSTESTPPSERTTGWRSVFSMPGVYRFAQNAIGAEAFRRHLVDEVLTLAPGDRVVDIGCGTADIVDHLPAVDYVGYDHSEEYVEAAKRRIGDRGTVIDAKSDVELLAQVTERDLAMAIGVLHHMDDDEVAASLAFADRALRPGGRLVTVDPTLAPGQHPIGRWLAKRDRGQHVRTPDATLAIVREVFPDATVEVRHDLLRVPYSHVMCRATKAGSDPLRPQG